MSDARITWKVPLHGAAHEVISGMSALNMEPSPLEKPTGTYLSETDYYVKHAMEHFSAACQLISKAEARLDKLLNLVVYTMEEHMSIDVPMDIDDTEGWVINALSEQRDKLRRERP